MRDRRVAALLTVAVLSQLVGVVTTTATSAGAQTLPTGFRDVTVFSGLNNPTAIQFTPDGRVFVAEKRGVISVYDNLADTTPTVFADLRTAVHNFWDRGLLGLTIDPQFPARPYVYVQYTYDALPGGSAPRWGTAGANDDPCPNPPGATGDGCTVQGRLSRLTVANNGAGNTMTGSELVLVNDWCNQFPSHSIGTVVFGPDGYLYAAGGDGGSFSAVDTGQFGGSAGSPTPLNPCNAGSGESGALRSQSVRTTATASAPVTLDGSVIRIDPDTGAAAPTNSFAGRADAKERMVVAYGLRNPFRLAFRPGTSELWIGDVGWNDWEEINRLNVPTGTPPNFGWPCYEGTGQQAGYAASGAALCSSLYSQGAGAVTAPYFAYKHNAAAAAGDGCTISGGSAIAGLAFYQAPTAGGSAPYPAKYDKALFFTDYNRQCIWAMLATNGVPDPTKVELLSKLDTGSVELVTGANGDLFWVDMFGGKIHRIVYDNANVLPNAVITTNTTSGPAPLTVNFSAASSNDPDGNTPLTYSWDLDGNGTFGDSTAVAPSFTYPTIGNRTVGLRVTDSRGGVGSATVQIAAGNAPPVATILTPTPSGSPSWRVGDTIAFTGSGSDAQDGALPASSLSWKARLLTCTAPSSCITRYEQINTGVAGGSFVAPDWEGGGNNVVEIELTATDSGGLTSVASVRLQPITTTIQLQSSPSGLSLGFASESVVTPATRTVIVGSSNSLGAPTPQVLGATSYDFASWSDGGAAAHQVVATAAPMTITATYAPGAASTVPPPTAGGWQRNGSATQSGADLVLTPVSPTLQAGSAFWPTAVPTGTLTASFDMSIAGGASPGGDGACFVLADPAAGATAVGYRGGGLGYSGIAGTAVCLDTYQNWKADWSAPVDPSNNFVGIATGGALDRLTWAATATNIPPIRTATRRVVVTVAAGRMKVSVDGAQVIDQAVTLTPTARVGFTAGTGSNTDRQAVSNVVITTSGATPTPNVTVSPSALDFGSVTVGQNTTRTFTISNTGTAAASVTAVSPPTGAFTDTTALAVGTTVAAGQTLTRTVRFAPTAAGAAASSYGITFDGGQGVRSVTLAGTGVAVPTPNVTVSPSSLDFGSVTVGQTATRTFTISNTGTAAANVTAVVPPGAPFSDASVLAVGTSLAAGASITRTLTFAPTAAAPASSSYSITFDGGQGVRTVTLAGVGVSAGGGSTIPAPPAGGWQYNGNAALSGQQLVLTTTSPTSQRGSAFWPTPVPSADLRISFDATIDSGTGADGLALVLADQSAGATALGSLGGGLGFAGIPGVAVALDTYQNWNSTWTAPLDPSANFVGLSTGPSGGGLAWAKTATNVPTLTNSTHHVDVVVTSGRVVVKIDNVTVIDQTVTIPQNVRVGFSAGTGSLVDRHAVTNVAISVGAAPPAPVVTVSPTSLGFGSTLVGTPVSRTFTISNTGTADAHVTAVTPPSGVFAATSPVAVGTTVAAGQTLTQTVTFAPVAAGSFSGSYAFTLDDGQGARSVALSGTATTGGATTVPAPAAGSWTFNGSAVLNGASLDVTPISPDTQAGSAFYATPLSSANGITVSFDALLTGGLGADGMCLVLANSTAGATARGATGGGLGFSGIDGVAACLDTYQNWNATYTAPIDPSANFVGVATGPGFKADTLTYAATSTNVPSLRDTVRHIAVNASGGRMKVSVDGVQVIDQAVTLSSQILVGFSGGTGEYTQRQSVSNVVITLP